MISSYIITGLVIVFFFLPGQILVIVPLVYIFVWYRRYKVKNRKQKDKENPDADKSFLQRWFLKN